MTVEHVEFLVEEASTEAALRILLPKMLGDETTFEVYPSNGKQDLLDKLPNRLRGYRSWLPTTWRVVVVVDRDDEDCRDLKRHLEKTARDSDLTTKSSTNNQTWQIVIRVAVEELEAWLFGDMAAVRKVYPRVSATIEDKAAYRDPDAIRGGTWEAFERVLQKAGYFAGGYAKIEGAREIAAHMEPQRNRSHSFGVFRDIIAAMRNA